MAIVTVGCKTARVAPSPVTEVVLPERAPIVMPSPAVELPQPAESAVPPAVPTPSQTNAPSTSWRGIGSGVWVPLERWCLANGLNGPRKTGADTYSVVAGSRVLTFRPGSQVVRWEGVNVWLGHAPRQGSDRVLLHALDVEKTLDPLLHRTAPLPRPNRVVVLDPGHGGTDSGTRGTQNQLEKHFTLDWALRVAALLQTNGWRVFLTRTNDGDVPLTNRVAFADARKADLFVSLHFNGLSARSGHSGVETYCLTPAGLPSSVTRGYEDNPGQEFVNNLFDRENLLLAFRLHRELLAATRAADGGVRRARFMTVLRGQRRPAVLIEGGFLSNPAEAGRIATAAYRQRLAEAVARALECE